MDFMQHINEKARQTKKKIVLPESGDSRILEAASRVTREGVASIILIGKEDQVRSAFPAIDLDGIAFMDPSDYGDMEGMADQLYQLRKHKGMSREEALSQLADPTTFGIMLLKDGLAQGLVSGAVNTTADTLRPALQILKTKPGTKLVSAYLLMLVPDCQMGSEGMFLMSDCALNVNPTAQELAEIALSSAASWQQLTGIEPRVAMLSYSTLGSGIGELPEKVAEATRIARQSAPHLLIDGELQADAALVPRVAAMKAGQSPVAGQANCLIFPDLNAGNIGYKLVERLARAKAYGPMLQGIAMPVNDLSRGCTVNDIAGVIALTAVQAQSSDQI